jgi:hypothetical protein
MFVNVFWSVFFFLIFYLKNVKIIFMILRVFYVLVLLMFLFLEYKIKDE